MMSYLLPHNRRENIVTDYIHFVKDWFLALFGT